MYFDIDINIDEGHYKLIVETCFTVINYVWMLQQKTGQRVDF